MDLGRLGNREAVTMSAVPAARIGLRLAATSAAGPPRVHIRSTNPRNLAANAGQSRATPTTDHRQEDGSRLPCEQAVELILAALRDGRTDSRD
jgi:hypothetical protein